MEPQRELTYPEAARAIAIWLDDFCDGSLNYPSMIAHAARNARMRIDELEGKILKIYDIIKGDEE
jgi:ketopantoate reductase